MKIYLDPRCDIRYASFYIQGLYDIYGKKNVIFSPKYSKYVSFDEFNSIVDRILLITFVLDNYKIKKIAIDARDPRSLLEKAYNWCDLYFKTNYIDEKEQEVRNKLKIIPPGFAISLWNPIVTLGYGFYNTAQSFFTHNYGNKSYLLNTLKTYLYLLIRRCKICNYQIHISTLSNYIFMICSLWNYEECISGTNYLRYRFMKNCFDNPKIQFDGGFVIKAQSAEIPMGWENLCVKNRISCKGYIKKTKKSFCVFNTPAVRECHGWKLPEFLCMGKAIISTPLKNDLPIALEHGENIHIVTSEEELSNAIELLQENSEYRKKLETKAKEYWDKYCTPKHVINTIIEYMQ